MSATLSLVPVALVVLTIGQQPVKHDRFVDRVVSFEPGLGAGYGEDKLPKIVLGPPQGGGKLKPSSHVLSLGNGGRITLEFVDNEVIDGKGPDILVFENPFLRAPGDNPNDGFFELAKVELSENGELWHEIPYDTGNRKGCAGHHPVLANSKENKINPADPKKSGGDPFDLKDVGLKRVRFIRITDLNNGDGDKGTTGFDLDAVVAVHSRPRKPTEPISKPKQFRFATFNVSMNRRNSGQLIEDLSTKGTKQIRSIAEIIQRVRPDVILLNEFDYDKSGQAGRLFQKNYLSVSQNGQQPIQFPHQYSGPVNTGVDSGFDFDNDGKKGGPADAFGFGFFPGQYGMLVLSRFPIDYDKVRTFQKFLWHRMPYPLRPIDEKNSKEWYSEEESKVLRLSSKSHWDVPIRIGERTIHFLASHPTPPVFDGPEDRNGCRNHDEIRFWADYVTPDYSYYIGDDKGKARGLPAKSAFIIAGDLNADPVDGDSTNKAAKQLTEHKLINNSIVPSSAGAVEQSRIQGGSNKKHRGNPAHDTADFNDTNPGNLRIDYVLPSRTIRTLAAGVFWPKSNEPGAKLLKASDHRLVWIDIMP